MKGQRATLCARLVCHKTLSDNPDYTYIHYSIHGYNQMTALLLFITMHCMLCRDQ